MKMKEIERLSGVSREAIRFYIREGLLPEPDRPKKNVARYHEAHVAGLRTIKQLQEEQLLPLDVIKAVMTSKMDVKGADLEDIGDIESALRALLPDMDASEPIALRRAAKKTGLSKSDILGLSKIGMVTLQESDSGEKVLSPEDVEILSHWGNLAKAGFSKSRGFRADMAQLYVLFTQWLADQEASLFLKHIPGTLSAEETAGAAAQGIVHLNAVLALMRKRALLDRLKQASETGPKKRKKKAQE